MHFILVLQVGALHPLIMYLTIISSVCVVKVDCSHHTTSLLALFGEELSSSV